MPFASTGGLGEVAGSLPAALVNSGVDCRVIMPLYEKVPQSVRDKMVFMGTGTVPVAWRRQYLGLFEMKQNNVTYYFVDNEYYFKRAGLYGYYDDGERFSYFSRAVFEAMEIAGFYPDIIHCNDWQTALVPVFQNSLVRREYLKTIFTIHNIEYQGQYSTDALDSIIGLQCISRILSLVSNIMNCEDGFQIFSSYKGIMEYRNQEQSASRCSE